MAISKLDIINKVAEHDTFNTKKAATEAVQIMIDTITEALASGDDVNLGNSLGTLKTGVRAARTGRNPQTGEALEIPESKIVKFQASAAFKAQLKGA